MKRKIFICSIFCSCLLFINGCSLQKNASESGTSSEPGATVQEPSEEATSSEVITPIDITDEDMKAFFSGYLTIDGESILTLNQKPKRIDTDYWAAYDEYKIKTKQILGKYLSADAKSKLDKQYIHDDFHYPRLLELNDYMITGFSKVEDVSIISKYSQNGNNTYEVMVTALANVIDVDKANEQYTWDESKGYYDGNISSDQEAAEAAGLNPDKIKVNLKYLVETVPSEKFEIKSVRENSGINLGTDQQANAKNNSFISRASYTDKVEDKDKEKINRFLDSFMKQDYNFYNYYRKAYNTNYEMFEIALASDLKLRNIINLKEDYKSQFSPLIIPVKDDIASLAFNADEDITIGIHISSTEKYRTYEVSVKTEATLVNGSIKTYEYTYLFTFEDDMILSVRFVNQKDILEEPIA